VIEDLNSTNGTYVNGKAVKKQSLQSGDSIDIGKYKIKFVGDSAENNFDKTMVYKAPTAPNRAAPVSSTAPTATMGLPETAAPVQNAAIKVLSGAAAGREVPLTKVVTTVGKPGVAVAAITKRQHGFVVHHVEGGGSPTLNGSPIGADPVALKNGDVIELAGTQMQFVQS
jgi:pSer/pThr/pTyr-binding forkhead associated (FHA) protein